MRMMAFWRASEMAVPFGGDIQLLKTGVEVRRVRMWRVARSGCALFRVEELMGRDNEIHIGVFVPVECVVRRDG